MQSHFRLPDTAMDAYCALLSSVLPNGHHAPSSFQQAVKLASAEFSDFDGKIGYICSGKDCLVRLSKQMAVCDRPQCKNFHRVQQCTGFVNYRIRPQLELLVQRYIAEIRREIRKAAAVDSTSVGDITSSRAYLQRLKISNNNADNELCLHLILSSDGAQPFKSGGASLWPCVAVLCELPPKIRSMANNCIVFGFWVGNQGKKKPIWTVFLESSIAELNSLRAGFDMLVQGSLLRVKVEVLCTLFDLPAQASIWSHKQYNGINGCIACRARGDRQGITIWPKTRDARPKDKHFFEIAWATIALSPQSTFYGVTSISPLSKLVNPAIVNAFDPMHMVYRGNAELIFSRFFENKPGKWRTLFSPKELRELIKDLDAVWFPVEFTRTIPPLDKLATFKASELKNLLIYAFLPATAPFMSELTDHWHWVAIYVHAIRLLSQSVVTEEDVQLAKMLIDTWQRLILEMAHELAQNFNAHGVQHLPHQVLKFGPLWATSAFCFESFNGDFTQRISSAKGPIKQIARRLLLQRYAEAKMNELEDTKPGTAAIIRKILGKANNSHSDRTSDESQIRLGKQVPSYRDLIVDTALAKVFGSSLCGVKFFADAYISGIRMHSAGTEQKRTVQHRSVVFKYNDMSAIIPSMEYASAHVFIEVHDQGYVVCKKFQVVSRTNVLTVPAPQKRELLLLYNERLYGTFYCIVKETSDFTVVPLEDVICKVVVVPCGEVIIVSDVLPYEHD